MADVTQADYDIAKAANREWGAAINGPHVAVLAAAMARMAAERAVVEWLRNGGGTDISRLSGSAQMMFLDGMNRYADAIERGEHLTPR